MIGVSKAAKKTLNKNPLINKVLKRSHAKTSKEHNKNKTANVSMN